jgi:hypothetical protein
MKVSLIKDSKELHNWLSGFTLVTARDKGATH